jgi:hypothetical protein
MKSTSWEALASRSLGPCPILYSILISRCITRTASSSRAHPEVAVSLAFGGGVLGSPLLRNVIALCYTTVEFTMPDPFTIRIFVPDGDPEGVRLIDRMNWMGVGVAFQRTQWSQVRQRPELAGIGVYILIGTSDDELPIVYIGQADGLRTRIESHVQNKEFWDRAIVFASTSRGLNRAHVTWLEYALIKRATETGGCRLDNGNAPQEPAMTEAEKADTQGFLKEVLQILPLIGLRAFEFPRAVAAPMAKAPDSSGQWGDERDTVIVPAQKDGFEKVFLGENCWYAIRIAGGMLDKIKFIAAYQSQPISRSGRKRTTHG